MLIGSSYAISGAPSNLANFGTKQEGVPGVDPPRDVVRIERDWTSGDIAQFVFSSSLSLERSEAQVVTCGVSGFRPTFHWNSKEGCVRLECLYRLTG